MNIKFTNFTKLQNFYMCKKLYSIKYSWKWKGIHELNLSTSSHNLSLLQTPTKPQAWAQIRCKNWETTFNTDFLEGKIIYMSRRLANWHVLKYGLPHVFNWSEEIQLCTHSPVQPCQLETYPKVSLCALFEIYLL